MNQGSFRLLYVSNHCIMDPCSSLGVNPRDLLALLHGRGWQCRAYTGPALAFEDGLSFQTLLADQRYRVFLGSEGKVIPCQGGPTPCSLVQLRVGDVPVSIFETAGTQPPGRSEGYLFLAHLERILADFQPDILLTHGDHWLTGEIIATGKRRKIPVVLWLEQLYYHQGDLLRFADVLLAPSPWVQKGIRDSLGRECLSLPPPLDWSRCVSPQVDGKYVTFVNPCPDKGVFFFAGIVRELRERRPQIPFLVVEGRGRRSWLREAGLDLDRIGNVFGMTATHDPRAFYGLSRLVVMPSLREEIFGRVAAEALANGIPVLGSDRGGLSEVLAQSGVKFAIPANHTPQARAIPTAQEVAPWVDAIMSLWDEPQAHQRQRERSLAAAEAWKPERLAARYSEMFSKIAQAAGRLPRRGLDGRETPAEGAAGWSRSGPSVAVNPPAPAARHGHRVAAGCCSARIIVCWTRRAARPTRPAICSLCSPTRAGSAGSSAVHNSTSKMAARSSNCWPSRRSAPASASWRPDPGPTWPCPTRFTISSRAASRRRFSTLPARESYQPPTPEEGTAYAAQFQQLLDEFRPDVMITYGSYPASVEAMARARLRGAALVFWLRNCAYKNAELFRQVDGILVPSRFSQEFYRKKLGIDCTPIPSPFVWDSHPVSRSAGEIRHFRQSAAEQGGVRLCARRGGDAPAPARYPVSGGGGARQCRLAETGRPRPGSPKKHLRHGPYSGATLVLPRQQNGAGAVAVERYVPARRRRSGC